MQPSSQLVTESLINPAVSAGLDWTPERVDLLKRLHLEDNRSSGTIARIMGFGADRDPVISMLESLGIRRRTRLAKQILTPPARAAALVPLPETTTDPVSTPDAAPTKSNRRGRDFKYDHARIRHLIQVEGKSQSEVRLLLGCSITPIQIALGLKTNGINARFQSASLAGRSANMPPFDHPALIHKHTIYPMTVAMPPEHVRLLKSGQHSTKIGGKITKTRWKGFPIYVLTLEERATCPTSCDHWRSCVVPGTKVLTAELEWVPIETLTPGQKIVGFDENPEIPGQKRKSRISTVEAVGKDVRPCMEVTTDRGIIVASADHLWVAQQSRAGYDWFKTDQLNPDDRILFFEHPWERDMSYESGRIRGFVEGEGYLSTWSNNGFTKTRLGWSQIRGTLLNEITDTVRSRGFSVKIRDVNSGIHKANMGLAELDGGWREILKFMGIFRPSRLWNKLPEVIENRVFEGRGSRPAKVISVRPVGDKEVITIATSTKTLITDGYLSHNCYGNKMHQADRIPAGPELERRLALEVAELSRRHPNGFAIRLHSLGDFYSVGYVELWRALLARHPQLHAFGYSARHQGRTDPIAAALVRLVMEQWQRFAIRFSDAPIDSHATVSLEHPIQKPTDAIICPEQVQRGSARNSNKASLTCGSCGLCWSTTRRIAFIQH